MNPPLHSDAIGPKRHILLVEDHPVTREGFAKLLSYEPDLKVCGQAGTECEALAAVQAANPDLVIIDISLPGGNGLELIKKLSRQRPALPLLVLSTFDETVYAGRSLQAGARGYLMKSAATGEILDAIRIVLNGKTYLSKRMNEHLVGSLIHGRFPAVASEAELLSDRELEIFTLIGQGQSTTQIAAALKLSPHTVATHRTHIQEKLRLESLGELTCRAAQWVQRQSDPH